MKAVKNILSILLWSIVTLYLLLVLLTHIPSVQGVIGRQTASLLGEKLNTEVRVGNVNLGFLNRVIIDDVAVYDQQQGEMLKVGRLSARVDVLPLMQGRISISSIQLFGAKIRLTRASKEADLNCQFVLDALASKDTLSHTPLDLRINSIIVRHTNLSYDQLDEPTTEQFNPKHLAVGDISAHIILKTLTDDSLNVNIKRMAFKEKSGLNVNRISLKLTAGRKNARLDNLMIQLPNSDFTIDQVLATYDANRLKETLKYEVTGMESSIFPSDFACFFAPLKNLQQEIDIALNVSGTGTSIQIPAITIDSPDKDIILRARAWAEDLQQEHPRWQATVENLNISGELTQELQQNIQGLPDFLTRIDYVRMYGTTTGNEQGDIHEDYTLNARMGTTAADLKLSGNRSKAQIKGIVKQLQFNDYTYQDILLDGEINAKDLLKGLDQHIVAKGMLTINDPNIRTQIHGNLQKNGKMMTVQLKGDIDDLSPKDLHLSKEWGDAIFEATFQSDFKASNLNDAEGSFSIQDFLMKDSLYEYGITRLELKSGYKEGIHFLQMEGDMGEAELTGQFDWDTLPQSFINFIGSQLPTLPGLPNTKKEAHNDFAIQVNLTRTDWMERLLNLPFLIYQPMTITANVNDNSHEVNVDARIPAFTYDGDLYQTAFIHIDTPQDTIACAAGVTKVMGDETLMKLNLLAHAHDNQLTTSMMWDNSSENKLEKLSGELNALTQLYTAENGKPEAYLHINPSHTIINGAKWNVMPSDIFYTDHNLNIEHFSVEHGKQHLSINGVASREASDTLNIDLLDVDVDYVLDLVNFHAVEFAGLATGKAYITQPFDSLTAKASLTVKEFLFENGRMGTLYADAEWNTEKQQIDIHAVSRDEPAVQTLINGYVSPVREDILLDIQAQGTYIDFTKTYTSSFLNHLTGHAYGNVQLVGPLGEMNLLGKLVIDGSAKVTPIGTYYTLNKDTLYLVENDILIQGAEIQDKYKNSAFISGGIHHDHLSNLTFDLDIETPQLLAYDFPDYGNEVFCGHILANGHVDLHGRPGEITINCNVTPLRTSVFKYNAASTDAVSNQDFITWNEKTTDTLATTQKTIPENVEVDIPSDLYLNFLVNTTPDANLRLLMDEKTNDYISLYGSGVIRASYHNKGAFTMYGTYEVDHGTYGLTIQNIIKKNFQFNEGGTMVFGGNPMNAALNLQAVHTVNGVSLSDLNIGESFSNNTIRVNCLMNILGQAGAPRLEFDLDMPNVNSEEKQMIRSIISSEQEMNQQVIYLLGIGRFYTQGINNANQNANQEYGQTQLAMQSFLSGTLSSQINDVIANVIKNENWNFGANISTGNEGWHNAEYEGLVSGRLFNNRLLIDGQFGYRDNARQATPSFIGDFDIRYLLQPNGNLALKVYNQTNDRYFTKSSLNTQGIGIIIKKDFSNIGELLWRKRKGEK